MATVELVQNDIYKSDQYVYHCYLLLIRFILLRGLARQGGDGGFLYKRFL